MPKVNINRDHLFKRLGKVYTQEEFEDLCFQYGVELDEVTSERDMILKETGVEDKAASDEVIYKIDVSANRYDLLCIEGIARSLNVYNGKLSIPKYHIVPPVNGTHEKLIVDKSVEGVRPVIVAGILRNIEFTQETYDSFIDLQEKLHANICKKRALVSIGTHDLDTVKGPFTYKALPPKEIKFVPLSQTKQFDAEELFNFYDTTNSHLKKYLHIIKDSAVYPGIYDSNNVLLSLPPIINGEHSKIKLSTKNVFIEVTATDRTKANIVLNTMLTMFAEYCKIPHSMEQVEVVEADGKSALYPQIEEKQISADVDYINKSIGINIQPTEMVSMLKRMSLESKLSSDSKSVTVSVPVTRSDIMHACDVMEDVAIGYGYNNLVKEIPKTHTQGRIQPINKLSELLSAEVALAGFTEIMTFVLCQNQDNFGGLNKVEDGSSVKIANAVSEEFTEVRTNLINSLMKSVVSNKAAPLPLKLFELSDVSVKGSTGNKDLTDPNSNNSDVGAYNKRMLGAIYCANSAKIEVIHGLLDRVMLSLNIKPDTTRSGKGYYLEIGTDKVFLPGTCINIIVNGKKVGYMGIIHPIVLKNYGCPFPCTVLELEVTMDLAKNIIYQD
ncbi:hypothetical protein DICPUDRAFT_50060 [Dictyostelium purpureum]|uniref:phenylalanine--tRNA ligase n=1 Tax=Dictyostelium purpureum TaxID=5786 RepID=F0ZWM6_DICPU|nr:uncharacterized protein DICPUDRAFT_50060 [Dictyostelium purpureum]EGC31656.1 hypothetical protein DICPUDRAFT_50060 [Dictyostelium purpureum]|eukprot:XP_003291822.1 hypothetical protein DICPUDRAFT_50060 [Dictyostelium purpureum]